MRGSPPEPEVEPFDGRDHLVRQVPGHTGQKVYRCPGCDQEIQPGQPHLVVWPVDQPAGVEQRRHWHTPCWAARDRRRARQSRQNRR